MKYLLAFLFVPFFSTAQPEHIFMSLEEALKLPEKVVHLDLSKQRLKEFPLEILNFPNLEVLDLSRNRISLLPAEIGKLKNLRILNLSKNRFSILPQQIGQLEKLKILNLARNHIDHLPEEIIQLGNLEILNLYRNSVQNFPEGMGNLEKLKQLDLRGTIIPEEELENLKLALPITEIQFTSGCYCGNGILKD